MRFFKLLRPGLEASGWAKVGVVRFGSPSIIGVVNHTAEMSGPNQYFLKLLPLLLYSALKFSMSHNFGFKCDKNMTSHVTNVTTKM